MSTTENTPENPDQSGVADTPAPADQRPATPADPATRLADLEARWGQGLFSGDRWIEVLWPAL